VLQKYRWGDLFKGIRSFLDALIFTVCFERWSRNLPHDREEKDYVGRKKHCIQNHRSINIARCLGTEERVSVDKVKVKQRRHSEAGAQVVKNAGRSHYSPIHQNYQ